MSTRAQEHNTIRCFIALTISQDTQNYLAAIQHNLKNNGAAARWTRPDHIHLTLRFLGGLNQKRVNEIAKTLPKMLGPLEPFPITITSLNAFPDIRKPRVVWIGISTGNEKIMRLFETINNGLEKLGIPKDQECALPHLTLARCKTEQERRTCADAIKKAPTFSVEAHPQSVTFYQSTLSSQGSIYVPITSIIFQ